MLTSFMMEEVGGGKNRPKKRYVIVERPLVLPFKLYILGGPRDSGYL